MHELAGQTRDTLGALAEALRDDHADAPMARLAQRIGLGPEHVELVWALVASSVDGRLLPHLEALGGGHARRGLSLSVYAMLAELADESVAALAHWLASPNTLVTDGLIVATEPASPAARAYVASSRLVSFLMGDDHAIAPLRIVRAPADLLHDADQLATIREVAAAMRRSANPILVVEGPSGSGRVTGCAQAAGAELIVLDVSRIAPEQLGESLTALRCETMLRALVPVIANVDHVLGDEQREQRRLIGGFTDARTGPILLTTSVAGIDLGTHRAIVRIPWDVAATEVRGKLWTHAVASIGAHIEGDLTALSHRYRVGPGAIERAVASVQLLHPAGTALSEKDLVESSTSAPRQNSRMWMLSSSPLISNNASSIVIAAGTSARFSTKSRSTRPGIIRSRRGMPSSEDASTGRIGRLVMIWAASTLPKAIPSR